MKQVEKRKEEVYKEFFKNVLGDEYNVFCRCLQKIVQEYNSIEKAVKDKEKAIASEKAVLTKRIKDKKLLEAILKDIEREYQNIEKYTPLTKSWDIPALKRILTILTK